MIKAIIFDCYGVLMTDGWQPFKHENFDNNPTLMQEAGDINTQYNLNFITFEDFIEQIAQLSNKTQEEVLTAVDGNKPNTPLFGLIQDLKADYKIGMLSNMGEHILHELFSAEQLALFDAVSLSCETGFVKPDERAYLGASEQLGVEPDECIMVDDLERNCTAAKEAGMQAVFYQNFTDAKAKIEALLANSKG